jgi:hypothetical protein
MTPRARNEQVPSDSTTTVFLNMKLRSNMAAARKALKDRLERYEQEVRREAAGKNHPDCVVRGDAISFGCESVDLPALREHPDFHCTSDAWLRRNKSEEFFPYGRIARFEDRKSAAKFWVSYQRQMPHLPHFRIAYFPDDYRGLRPEEICSVLEATTGARIARMELATDLGFETGIDSDDVRRHFISGKSQARSVHETYQDTWGGRHSGKFIRSYAKREIGAHRVEIQFNGRFLRAHQIDTIFDFQKLAALLPDRHLYFAELNEQKLIQQLRLMHMDGRGVLAVLREVEHKKWHLCGLLKYLRQDVGMKNVRRLLDPLPVNDSVLTALEKWVSMWPKKPTPLGPKK